MSKIDDGEQTQEVGANLEDSLPIYQVKGLPPRARRALSSIGVRTVGQYRELDGDDLKWIRNCGPVTLEAMQHVLGSCGITKKDHTSIGVDHLGLRQWYAGLAMQGILPSIVNFQTERDMVGKVTKIAFLYADAMLKAGSSDNGE